MARPARFNFLAALLTSELLWSNLFTKTTIMIKTTIKSQTKSKNKRLNP
jgi:hypothetical protein